MTAKRDILAPIELASYLDIQPGSIYSLVDQGVVVAARNSAGAQLKGRYDLLASVVGYIRFLRTRKATKTPEQLEFERARNLKALAKAEEAAIKVAQLKGEMHSTASILSEIGAQHVAFKQKMLTIPTKTARVLAAETDHLAVQKILTGEVREALNELRGFKGKTANGRHAPVRPKRKK